MRRILYSIIFIVFSLCHIVYAETGSYAEGEKNLTGGIYYVNYAPSMMYKFTVYDHRGSKLLSKIVSPEKLEFDTLSVKACNGKYPFDLREINLKNIKIYENGSEKTINLKSEYVFSEHCVALYKDNLISDWCKELVFNATDFASYAVRDKTCTVHFLTVLNEIGAYELNEVKNCALIEGVSDQFESWLRTEVAGERPYVVCEPVSFMLPKNCYGTDGFDGTINKGNDGEYKQTKFVSGVENKWYLCTVKDYKSNSKFHDSDNMTTITRVSVSGGSEGLQKCKAHLDVTQYKYKAPLL